MTLDLNKLENKLEPIQTYQNGSSSKTLSCVKCGKQAWQHPIITYTK